MWGDFDDGTSIWIQQNQPVQLTQSPWPFQSPSQTPVWILVPGYSPNDLIPPPLHPSASERKRAEDHARASAMASTALHGVQPRNSHHRSLRGYADAPRRPCYRGARGGR